MAADGFDRAMESADWDEVYARQQARANIIPDIVDALALQSDDILLEIGSGPGYTAMCLSEQTPVDSVVAVDRHPAALRYLRQKASRAGVTNIQPVTADAHDLPVRLTNPVKVLLAFVLHHDARPASVLSSLAARLPPGSSLLIIEYHPDAAGDVGPPVNHRIAPSDLREWLANSGLREREWYDYPEEKYGVKVTVKTR